ncbi:Rz-like lysis system protein LysB [Glaciimonas sp. GG7]
MITPISTLIIGILGATLYLQNTHLIAAKERADRAEKQSVESASIIHTLKESDAKNRKALGTLQAQRASITATLSQREQQIKTLHHENIAIRHWAESALPDAIARLRQRPATTGAEAYRQRLSASDALHPASKRADN